MADVVVFSMIYRASAPSPSGKAEVCNTTMNHI